MHDKVLGRQSPDFYVTPHLSTAGENHAALALARGQGMFRVLQFEDLARRPFTLTGATITCLATVGEAHAVTQERAENGLAILGRHKLRIACDSDGPGHGSGAHPG